MMRWMCVAVVCAALSACGGGADQRDAAANATPQSTQAAPAPATVTADNRARILIVGTSLTAGYGLDPADAYPSVLQHIADSLGVPVRIVNAGLSGETSAGALRRIDWLLNEPADVVIVETGANDGLRGLDPDTTAANLRAIVGTVRAKLRSAKIVIAQMEAPPNLGPVYIHRFHAVFGDVARETHTKLMPFLLDSVAGDPRLNQGDGIHPNEVGAKIVARNVWRTLAALLPK